MFQRTTSRLVLTELSREDSALMLAILNDPDFVRNVADRGVRTLQAAEDYLQRGPIASYREHNFGMYKVALRDGRPIGLCGLVKRDFLEDVDIGYALLPEYRGQGYALEAAREVMDFACNELRLPRILAIVSPANVPSIRLLEKIGLRREGNILLPGESEEIALLAWQGATIE